MTTGTNQANTASQKRLWNKFKSTQRFHYMPKTRQTTRRQAKRLTRRDHLEPCAADPQCFLLLIAHPLSSTSRVCDMWWTPEMNGWWGTVFFFFWPPPCIEGNETWSVLVESSIVKTASGHLRDARVWGRPEGLAVARGSNKDWGSMSFLIPR